MRTLFLLTIALLHLHANSITQHFGISTIKPKYVTKSQTKTFYGYIKPQEERIYDVVARFDGYITQSFSPQTLHFIKKDAPLVRIYSAQVLQAKEDYIAAQNFTGTTHQNMQQSSLQKLQLLNLPSKELDALKTSKSASIHTHIYAPQSGYIAQKNVYNGSAFKAGDLLFRIINIDEVYVDCTLFSHDISTLNEYATFDVELFGVSYEASKRALLAQFNTSQSTGTLRLKVKNPHHTLLPNAYTTIKAHTKPKKALLIPQTAAIQKDNLWYVFKASEYQGEYEPTLVQLKPFDDVHYEILNNTLDAKTSIANNALFMLDSDAQVNGMYP